MRLPMRLLSVRWLLGGKNHGGDSVPVLRLPVRRLRRFRFEVSAAQRTNEAEDGRHLTLKYFEVAD